MNLGMERLFDYQVEDDDKTALIADEEVTSFIAHVTAWKLERASAFRDTLIDKISRKFPVFKLWHHL